MRHKWPYVTRGNHEAALKQRDEALKAKDADLAKLRWANHALKAEADELRSVKAALAEISRREVQRCYSRDGRFPNDVFALSIRFTPELIRGLYDEHSMSCFAKHVAYKVEREIATMRFLQHIDEPMPKFQPFTEPT